VFEFCADEVAAGGSVAAYGLGVRVYSHMNSTRTRIGLKVAFQNCSYMNTIWVAKTVVTSINAQSRVGQILNLTSSVDLHLLSTTQHQL
jgi:uncharacterized protein YwlG (UPF0340 family)